MNYLTTDPEIMTAKQRVEAVYCLQARIYELTQNSASLINGLVEFGKLTRGEAKIIAALSSGRVLSRDQLLYAYQDDTAKSQDATIINVLMCRARKKLAGHGVKIKNIHNVGYKIESDHIDILKRLANGNQ